MYKVQHLHVDSTVGCYGMLETFFVVYTWLYHYWTTSFVRTLNKTQVSFRSPYEHVNCKRISYQKKCKTIGQAKLIDNHTRLKLQIAEYTAAVSTQNHTITMKKILR